MVFIKRTITYTVTEAEDGASVYKILKSRLKASTAIIGKAKKLDDGIMLNGERVFTTATVKCGGIVSLVVENGEKSSENIEPIQGEVDILYEDDDFLIINKQSGVPVHPSQGHFTDSLANFIAFYMQEKGNNFVFRAINRLDANTSGVMAIAKNAYINARMKDELHSDRFYREYLAITEGEPPQKIGTIDAPIARFSEMSLLRVVREDGDRAVTHYEVLRTIENKNGKFSLVRVWLETGRTHQIRVHFAHIGCPVAGDFLYGKVCDELPSGHALHAHLLRFTNPITGETMEFKSELPKEMQSFLLMA